MRPIVRPELSEVRAAARGLADVLTPTPLVPLHTFEGESPIRLKPEIHQPIGSFKLRGVYHAVAALAPERRAAGVSTVSAGNTAQALAWSARRFGVRARSLMPETAPRAKIEAVERYGGTPVLVPVAEVFRFLEQHGWEGEPYAFVHPWIDRDVLIGHGTLALELLAEEPALEVVFLPVGGGGLLAGVASVLRAAKPDVRIVAVEPEGCPSFHTARREGKPRRVPCQTICDGVAVPYVTEELFPLLCELVDECVLVSEARVRAAVRRLALRDRIVAEPSGALAVAAAEDARLPRSTRAVAVITGGSIDAARLAEILAEPPAPAS